MFVFRFFQNFRGGGGFGGFSFNFGDEPEEEVRRGDDVVLILDVSLTDAYVGKDFEVSSFIFFNLYHDHHLHNPWGFRLFAKKLS